MLHFSSVDSTTAQQRCVTAAQQPAAEQRVFGEVGRLWPSKISDSAQNRAQP